MKNSTPIKFLLVTALSIFIFGHAPAQEVHFKKLTVNQGLSYNTVYAIGQDQNGFMWFATREGLNRYDSYTINTYYIQSTKTLESANKINALLCDNSLIYLGTDNGLYIYDAKTDQIAESALLKIQAPVNFLLKSKATLFIGTSDGLYQVDNGKAVPLGRPHVPARAMGVLPGNTFLVFLGNKLQIISRDGEILKTFNEQDLDILRFQDLDIYTMYPDAEGLVWLCTNHGLFYYQPSVREFSRLNFCFRENQEANTVRAITANPNGLLYIGTEDGLYIYNRLTGEAKNYKQSFENDPEKLNDNAIYSIYLAGDSSIWLGTYFGGVNYIPSNTYGFQSFIAKNGNQGLSGKAVSQMMEDSLKNIWIGTEDGGITIYHPDNNAYSYINKNTSPYYLSVNNVHAIENDGYGNIWVGTFMGGLHQFDLKRQKTIVYRNRPGDTTSLSNNYVYAIYRDSRGKLWIGTQNGLNLFDYKTKKFSLFRPDIFRDQFIYDIIEDSDQDIWFCSRYDGIYRYNPSAGSVKHYSATGPHARLPSNQIISVYQDSKRRLWFGTLNGGACIYSMDNDSFDILNTSNGLINDNVYGTLEDNDGFIWLTTNRGLSRYNPRNKHFTNYDSKYGLPSNQFNFKSYLKSSKGRLFFGSINGLCSFNPTEITQSRPKIPLRFTDFKLFNKSVVPSRTAVLKKAIDYTNKIEIPYAQKVFSISYAAINYGNPGSTKYAYYLEGFEKGWNDVGDNNSVAYTNLSPGNYIFHVRAVQPDGSAYSNERTLHIRIMPPFYLTKTAYGFYAFLLCLLIWSYARFVRFLHQKKLEVQIQRIEKEKTEELAQNRLTFFTFISHEFKTPLTLILASIEKFAGERTEEFKKNPELLRIKNSASILFRLVQQLMEFRKIETNYSSVNLSYLDLISFAKETTHFFDSIANNKGVSLEFQADQKEMLCYFDTEKLEKILFNLISNAIQNTDSGKISVSIRFKEGTKSTRILHINVSDTGKGMSPQEVKNIFNLFYKSSGNKEGSGIGLALVGALVKYLNGETKIQSTEAQGTKIEVLLPILLKPSSLVLKQEIENARNPNISSQTVSTIEAGDDGPRKYTLLIVEDNRELLSFLSKHFSKSYQVVTASNGASALKKIEKAVPDVIVSDVKMPKMDGIELCRRLKDDDRFNYIPVVLLSGQDTDNLKIDVLDVGADAYLNKPFILREFELVISNMIKSRTMLRAHVAGTEEFATEKLPNNNRNQEFLNRLSEVLERRFSDSNFTVEDLARDLRMSRTSLHQYAKKVLDKSASELLNEYRLRRACVMLKNNIPVKDTAYYCGYNDPNYFSRMFKTKFGITPTQYKDEKTEAGILKQA